ncbi:MAG: hypothetical protein ACD_7C00367G0002 [uncultured bacterium]|nr:MAG: hypothetical protein ACD_7C00367G0002 [uncultured bacterium]
MKKTIGATGILSVIGIVLGFWGSTVVHLSWLIAPFVGFILMRIIDEMPTRYGFFIYYPKWFTALIISAGIVFGGLFIWVILAGMWIATLENFSWLPILQIFVTATLFFLGAVVQILYCWRQEKKWASRIG